MSDTQQGPDWWLASDGRWYPPQSRQLPPPPPPPWPPTAEGVPLQIEQPTVGKHLPGWLQGLLWASAATLAIAAVFVVVSVSAGQSFVDGDRGSLERWMSAENSYNTFVGLSMLLGIAVFVLLIIWTYRIHKVSSKVVSSGRKWSKGWSVGGWFIPIANFIIPPMVIGESARIAECKMRRGSGAGWKRMPKDSLLIWWWLLYAAGIVLMQAIGITVSADINIYNDFETYKVGMWIGAGGVSLTSAGLVCAALFVRRATRLCRFVETSN